MPVLHDGELLGGLSLVKEQGETVTPAEELLLGDLASGLGLALRNARLTEQLRRQVAELEASRERVLAAADAARRELENTLDSGPQQQLVALKVKLGPTRKRAEQLGATKTAGLLAQLEQQAGDAIKAVRDFAGGIYPPLLEAEGLAVAIGQQARASAIPVSVHGDGLSRYSREVEAAVYFSVLEALQNSAKYAEATSATVALSTNNGSLTFEVRDDGQGFDAEHRRPRCRTHRYCRPARHRRRHHPHRFHPRSRHLRHRNRPDPARRTGLSKLLTRDWMSAQTSSSASMLNDDFGRNPNAPASRAGWS